MGQESLRAAQTFVYNNADLLLSCLPTRDKGISTALYDDKTDVYQLLGELDRPKKGPSASLCAALSLFILLGRCELKAPDVVVTGTIDLRGRVGSIGAFSEKLDCVMDEEIELFVAPALNLL